MKASIKKEQNNMPAEQSQLKFFSDYIEKEIGIIYSETNYFQLEHRLNDIVSLLGYKDIGELWENAKVKIDSQLRDLLLDLATNNETSFFRDAAIFSALVEKIVPDLQLENPGIAKVRIWSAAGSTGQEAYSIAMSMAQAEAGSSSFPEGEILVTDVSERVLKKAREGVYSQLEAQRGLESRLLAQYFDKVTEDEWRVKSELRNKLSFRKINLLEPFPEVGSFDIIFCRNVLIYQSVENKTSVVEKILKCLGKGRYLILGAAESMLGVSNDFEQIHYNKAVFYKKKQ